MSAQADSNDNWTKETISPIENSSVHHEETVNFNKYQFVTGPVEKGSNKSVIPLEGKVSAILYKATEKNSTYEIFSFYKAFLKNKKFDIVFTCEKNACGVNFNSNWYDLNPFAKNDGWNNSAPITNGSKENLYYIAAKKKADGSDFYVSIFINAGWWNYPAYKIDVVQVKSMEAKVIPASQIGQMLITDGHISFYGITFDSGKYEIKPESEETLAELSTFLKSIKNEKFYVVGHTDDMGVFADNMKLSEARALSVVDVLTKKYGVSSEMLEAYGVGSLVPVAPNDEEEGRNKNRRVEIVKKLKTAPIAPSADLQRQEAEQKRLEMIKKQKEAEQKRQDMMNKIKGLFKK
jgi:outer membrane protein OmpA-like peptidoglycan-associated protein